MPRPKDAHVLPLRTWECVTYVAKRPADMLQVENLRLEDDPGSSGVPSVITRVLTKGGGSVRVSEGDAMMAMSDSKTEGLEDATPLALRMRRGAVSHAGGLCMKKKARERILLHGLRKKHSLADLVKISELQNCRKINVQCFEPQS